MQDAAPPESKLPAGIGPFCWYALYNVVLHLGALCCLPFWLFVRLVRGRYRGQFKERMGILAADKLAAFGERPALWFHAASAGETASAAPLVRALKELLPGRPVLFTVTSRYGKEMAERRLGDVVDAICFSPLDLPLFCLRFLNRIRPCLYVMVETDLWPNMVRRARARGVPIAIASGHAGPGSFPRSFWRAVLAHVDLFGMQTDYDAGNIVKRGAPAERVHVLGNLKFDGSGRPLDPADVPSLRADLGMPDGVPILVAGSTLAEDEGPVLDAIQTLRAEGLDLHAIVAPRRQERVPEFLKACAARGLATARRTEGGGGNVPILVLDTMGELAGAYNVADAAYVGGGLTPEVGLHNLLEPLVCGVPLLFGKHHGKAHRIAGEVLRTGSGIEVADAGSFLDALRRVLADAAARRALVDASRTMLAHHRGAAERVAARIKTLLP